MCTIATNSCHDNSTSDLHVLFSLSKISSHGPPGRLGIQKSDWNSLSPDQSEMCCNTGTSLFFLFDISRLKNQNHLGIGQSILRAGATQCIPNLYSVHPYYSVLQNQTGSHHILSRFIPMSCGCLGLSKKSTKSTHLTCVTVLAQFYTTSTLKAHLFLWNLLKTRTQM